MRLDIVVNGARKCVRRVRTGRIVRRNAVARMVHRAMLKRDSVSVRLDGKDIAAIGRVTTKHGAKTARNRVIASMMVHAIHRPVNAPVDQASPVITVDKNAISHNSVKVACKNAIAISIIPFPAIISMVDANARVHGLVSKASSITNILKRPKIANP